MRVVGVDGCPGGWVAVTWDTVDKTLVARVHPTFVEVLDVYQDAAALGVDIPIGLGEGQPRQCDLLARKAISPRGSCVFPAPDARLVEALIQTNASAHDFRHALSLARELTNKGISKQVFYICPKITEVNLAMTPELQQRVFEIHPEVSFWALAGKQPMVHKKRRQAGYDERAMLLEEKLDVTIWPRKEAFENARPAKPDDVLDAAVAAWTARRVSEDNAELLPTNPPIDRRGLRMAIVY
jgi:predicted RNase H-like nuclease